LFTRGLFGISKCGLSSYIQEQKKFLVPSPRKVLELIAKEMKKELQVENNVSIGIMIHLDEFQFVTK
jgi:hypothetical protein